MRSAMFRDTKKLKYHCVEVIAGDGACDAARSLKDVRVLSEQAPLLPLRTCDQPATCKCVYRHFDDRRHGPRREYEHATKDLPHMGAERRTGRGRRATDHD
jgi:hypothetical protein